MKTRILKVVLVSYALFAASSIIWPATARPTETPSEAIAACIRNAWNVNSACQTDGIWWNDVPCAIKFEADVILCASVLI